MSGNGSMTNLPLRRRVDRHDTRPIPLDID